MANSIVHRRWLFELAKVPEKYVIHELHRAYPDGKIDVIREQAVLESFDTIIFQYPIFWFNYPPLLKQWPDEVLVQGWAFGTDNEYKLKGKKIKVAVSAGIVRDQHQPDGECQYTMDQFLAPFEFTYKYVKADYRPHLVLCDWNSMGQLNVWKIVPLTILIKLIPFRPGANA
ncbi:NAD(P)H-dependent oxidoreductase [Pedobacter sp.]|uniref:NAD(P)H-dependent oxidoreductase n=1 Tax=Pedobacter sp. TaxID=1411316 RepID=UPI003BA8FCF0